MANNRELSQFANIVGHNGGNIGIGTDNPLQKLHLSDTTSANIYLQTHNSGTGSTAGVYFRTSNASTVDGFFKTAIVLEDDGTSWARGKLHILQNDTADDSNATLDDSVLMINNNGNIGVGYGSPSEKLVVKGTTSLMATNSTNRWMAYTYTDDTFRLNYNGSGSDELTITSGGNIGVNESSNINGRLHVQHDALNENILYSTRYNDQSNDKPIFAVTEATMSGMTASGTVIGNHNRDIHIGPVFDSSAAVSTSIVTGIRIEAVTGNIGLGTDNPADILHLQNNAPIITSEATNNSSGLRINVLGQTTDTTQIFRVQRDGTTKFTILRSGNVGVNYTTPVGKFCVKEDTSSSTTTIFRVRSDWGASNQTQMLVLSDGDIENRNNAYRAISDAKLKENIVDASSQWEDIKNLRVRNYNFIEGHGDPSKTHIGVVAQEVETVCPGLVKERPDQDDETGDYLGTVTKSVSYSVLYMKAVKALQEAQTRIETLEAQHADLLARVTALEG